MKAKKTKKFVTARNSNEISEALGIHSAADRALVRYKAQLSKIAVQTIQNSNLQVNEIVKRAGIARSKVSAIKNGSLVGISCDLFIKVIVAAGGKLPEVKLGQAV
jgi:predicted XRE-type DNA-binding protein